MPGIFISYRRSDSAGHAGRLTDDLGEQLGVQALFRDLEAIEAGADFVAALEKAVSDCSVLLVVIGPDWASATTADGQRRLFQPDDFVRMEVEAALQRDIRIIPVLVGEATMPDPQDVPESMAGLLRRNAYVISDRRWQYDVSQLVDILIRQPGIAMRRSPAEPASLSGRANGWIRLLAAGVGVVIVAVSAWLLWPRGQAPAALSMTDPGSSVVAATEEPAAGAVEPSAFYGDWRAANGESYNIDLEEEGQLYVAAGTSLDDGTGFGPNSPAPTRPGQELYGNGTIEGRRLRASLVDSVTSVVHTLRLELSGDGVTLSGDIQSGSSGISRPLLLLRR